MRPLTEYESPHLSKPEQVQVKLNPVRLVWVVWQHAAALYNTQSKDHQQCIRPLTEYESPHLRKFEQVQVKLNPVRLVWGLRQKAAALYTLRARTSNNASDHLLRTSHRT